MQSQLLVGWLDSAASYVTMALEVLALGIIALTAIYSLVGALASIARRRSERDIVGDFRRRMARGVLAGLEALVAADIIKSAAVELSFRSVGVLVIIVLVRTFLSFTLELELTGRWPWQTRGPRNASTLASSDAAGHP